MRVYLDVETYRPNKEDAFTGEKVIAIGILEDWTPYSPRSSGTWGEPHVRFLYLTEWKLGNEHKVISEFYNYLKGLVHAWKNGRISFLNIVGFNILRYDIPLLIQKGVEYSIGGIAELNALWHNTFIIDYFQATLPFKGMSFKGLRAEYLAEIAERAGISVPKPYGSGGDVKEWYEKRDYGEIMKHLETDLKIIRLVDLNYKSIYGL